MVALAKALPAAAPALICKIKWVWGRGRSEFQAIVEEIRKLCHDRLDPHQVPVTFREVPSIEVAASGKLVRPRA